MIRRTMVLLVFLLFFIPNQKRGFKMGHLKLFSDSFNANREIPMRYTCQGENISPELHWNGVPVGTKSFVLIVEDPDAPDPAHPRMTWVHWVLYNIPDTVSRLPEGISDLPQGTLEGINDWGRKGYGGPCPPIGRHRYFFKLYALNSTLKELAKPTKEKLVSEMKGKIIEEADLIGLYKKKNKKSEVKNGRLWKGYRKNFSP